MKPTMYLTIIIILACTAGCDDDFEDTTNPYRPYFSLEEALKDSATVEVLILNNIGDSLSPKIGKLKNLRGLTISYSDIRYLPDEIALLKQLESVVLTYNQFESVPPQLHRLHGLLVLAIGHNKIMHFPDSIAQTRQLEVLGLHANQITTFPSGYLNLGSVRSLWLDSKRISMINVDSLHAPNLKRLSLKENPIPAYMKEQLRQRLPGVELIF